ncbi:hypothetical protein LEMLEM_LOCUS21576, partial [Lemmus lemmus]
VPRSEGAGGDGLCREQKPGAAPALGATQSWGTGTQGLRQGPILEPASFTGTGVSLSQCLGLWERGPSRGWRPRK